LINTQLFESNLVIKRKYILHFLNTYFPQDLANLINGYNCLSDIFDPNCIILHTISSTQNNSDLLLIFESVNVINGSTVFDIYPKNNISHIIENYLEFEIPQFTHNITKNNDNSKFIENNGNLLPLIQTLICYGKPILLPFPVFHSFLSEDVKKTGIVPIPTVAELNKLNNVIAGWIEVVIVGYESGYLINLNSWGKEWGIDGCFKMPIEYLKYTWEDYPLIDRIAILNKIH
jgi:hypothetical protein